MRKILKRAVAAAVALAASFAFAGCAEAEREYTCIDGEKIAFATESEMENWREPLIKLLSNEEQLVYGDGDAPSYEAPDPNSPSIADCYACALFDVNFDGVPELWADLGGGSAGNSLYKIYDIYTGEELGTADGGQSGAFCVYYDTEAGELKNIGNYTWRGGWDTRLHFATELCFDEEAGSVTEEPFLFTRYSLDMVKTDENVYDEICTNLEYSVYGVEADIDAYLTASARFEQNCIRIKETSLCYVYWRDVTADGDTAEQKGEKMAAALLSAGQKFIANG